MTVYQPDAAETTGPRPPLKVADGEKTLRDEFAMMALTGMLSAGPLRPDVLYIDVARTSYRWADAMLSARRG